LMVQSYKKIDGSIVWKFVQVLNQPMMEKLEAEAAEREISIQELIRGVIIPEWLMKERIEPKTNYSSLSGGAG
jgi:hypothetical protein